MGIAMLVCTGLCIVGYRGRGRESTRQALSKCSGRAVALIEDGLGAHRNKRKKELGHAFSTNKRKCN
jgi:hypothetical protein